MRLTPIFTAMLLVLTGACDGGADEGDPNADIPLNDEYGKPLLDVDQAAGKADTFDGVSGPLTSGLSSTTEVWEVTTRWYKTDSAAGIAWDADTELTWDEKYGLWIDSLEKDESGYSTTFTMTTPWGKTLPSPRLECAEVAMFMRATFASWYGLPFYLTASTSRGRIYYGHFGIVDAGGKRLSGYPRFARDYKDYTGEFADLAPSELAGRWPSDSKLRSRYLTSLKDDRNDFLGDEAYAGAYFDEIFLNKRTGHFMLRMLTNFGSMHLASSSNMFNLKPDSIRAGDTLLERWQRRGIGHTLVVKSVTARGEEKLEIESMFGSMPRIQPKWYGNDLSKSYFTSELTGGEGENYDGEEYASLGGGLKRWRTPVVKSGRWLNIVPVADRESFIEAGAKATIAARPGRFEELMGQLSPEEEKDVLMQRLDDARTALSEHPASCANRVRREEAFDELYALQDEHFDTDKLATDAEFRLLDDYVFAELVYDRSKTCCWNRSTAGMYQIIMALNEQHVLDDSSGTCNEPIVFKAVDGGYDVFADFAAEIGQADAWVAWSEDETCPAADTMLDQEAEHRWTQFCEVKDDVLRNSISQ